jgi:uncharacterized protein YodC (DUF2158 family)
MAQFKQGDTIRKKSGGPLMTVDGYTASGEVVCTYWIKESRKQGTLLKPPLSHVRPSR